MQFNIATILALAGAVSAAPASRQTETIACGDAFGLVALHSTSPVHFQTLQARQSTFFSGLPSQNASCDADNVNTATFTIGDDGSLNLYSQSAPYQQAYVDASGMGQGIWKYTTGAQPAPTNSQRGSFTLDSANDLHFNNQSFLACPYLNGSYSFWVDVGVASPGGHEDCVGVSLRAIKGTTPVGCLYTE